MIDFGYGVHLGPLREENVWLYHDDRNTHSIWKWCRQYEPIQEGQHVQWFTKVSTDTSSIKMYEVLNDSGNHVGVCGLTDIDYINSRAEFSIYIRPKHQRKGYARKCLKTLLGHGFLNLGLNIVWGETYEGNPAFKLFMDLGMTHEGVRDEFYYRDGQFIDANLISMSRLTFDDLSKTWPALKIVK